MANEKAEFSSFCSLLANVFTDQASGKAYLIIDTVSVDNTLELANSLADRDSRFEVVWAPENRSVAGAYTTGYRAAYGKGHELIIEMDANLSHDPKALPVFLKSLNEGYECVFGSRFIRGGSMDNRPLGRKLLSYYGTIAANLLLGTRLKDMTSGYQGFQRHVIADILDYQLKSTGHFFQTELRYLLRNRKYKEVPIHYQAPSSRVSSSSLKNAWTCLWYYLLQRLRGNNLSI